MGITGLSRDSIRDISGNLVPLGIILFFVLWYLLDAPWGWDLLALLVVYGLFGLLALSLMATTYVFARWIQTADPER